MNAHWQIQPLWATVPCAGTAGCGCADCGTTGGTRSLAGKTPPVVPRKSGDPQIKALFKAIDAAQGLDAKLAAAGVELWEMRAAGNPHNIATTVALDESDAVSQGDLCVLIAGLNGYEDASVWKAMPKPLQTTVADVCNDPGATLAAALNRVAQHDAKAAARLSMVMEAHAKQFDKDYAALLASSFAKQAWAGARAAVGGGIGGAGTLLWDAAKAALPIVVLGAGALWLFKRGQRYVENPRRRRQRRANR